MKRVGGLWPQLRSFANLLAAANAAAAGKRRRPDVAAFFLDLEPNLVDLQRRLESGTYQPGPYRTFEIREPKPRQISAAPCRNLHLRSSSARTDKQPLLNLFIDG